MLLVLVRAIFVLVVAGFGVRTARIVSENQLANPYCRLRRGHARGGQPSSSSTR